MHKNNKHSKDYNFKALIKDSPQLAEFVFESKYGKDTIDFANPKAVKSLNSALLKTHYGIQYWDFPYDNLCPPIPGRVDYIHHLADLLGEKANNPKVLDVGTGASCIYPILGASEYQWSFVATEIDQTSFNFARKHVNENSFLKSKIEIRFQENKDNIFEGVVGKHEQFDLTMCNPPFHRSRQEAMEGTKRKEKNLKYANATKKEAVKNFGGTSNELWCKGGEVSFVRKMILETVERPKLSTWFTTLVSKKESLKSLGYTLEQNNAAEVKVIPMQHGNKISRILAWRF